MKLLRSRLIVNIVLVIVFPLVFSMCIYFYLQGVNKIYEGKLIYFYSDNSIENLMLVEKINDKYFNEKNNSYKNYVRYKKRLLIETVIKDESPELVEKKLYEIKSFIDMEKNLLLKLHLVLVNKSLVENIDYINKQITKRVNLVSKLEQKLESNNRFSYILLVIKLNNEIKFYEDKLIILKNILSFEKDPKLIIQEEPAYPKVNLYSYLTYFTTLFIGIVVMLYVRVRDIVV